MRIKNIRLLGVTNDVFAASNKHYITLWIESDWQSGEPKTTEPDKFIDQGWFDFQSLPSPLFDPCWKNLRKNYPHLFKK